MTGLSSHVSFTWPLTLWPHMTGAGWVSGLRSMTLEKRVSKLIPSQNFQPRGIKNAMIWWWSQTSKSCGDGSLMSTSQRPMSTKVVKGPWVRRGSYLPLSWSLQREDWHYVPEKRWLWGTVRATDSSCLLAFVIPWSPAVLPEFCFHEILLGSFDKSTFSWASIQL